MTGDPAKHTSVPRAGPRAKAQPRAPHGRFAPLVPLRALHLCALGSARAQSTSPPLRVSPHTQPAATEGREVPAASHVTSGEVSLLSVLRSVCGLDGAWRMLRWKCKWLCVDRPVIARIGA